MFLVLPLAFSRFDCHCSLKSDHSGLHHGSSELPRKFRLVSRTPYGDKSGSLGGACSRTSSHSPAHRSVGLAGGSTLLPLLCMLFFGSGSYVAFLQPLQKTEISTFYAGQDPNDQPFSSYCLLIGDVSFDLLSDINDYTSPSTRMRSKKVLKLLPYLGVLNRQYYCVEGEEVVRFWALL